MMQSFKGNTMAKHYQNPIVTFDPVKWSEEAQFRFMKFNIFANKILPCWLLNMLNSSPASRAYKMKEKTKKIKKYY